MSANTTAEFLDTATSVKGSAHATVGLGQRVKALLTPLASMNLTVLLLFLGMFIVLQGTLEQTRREMLDVKHDHFYNLFVYMSFQSFFPPGWFPQLQNIRFGFFFPSGGLVMGLMLVNLLAAHTLRFRLQASGARLWAGVGVVALGCVITFMVIANGQNAKGFQAEPMFSPHQLWNLMRVGLAGLGVLSLVALFRASGQPVSQRFLLGFFAVVSLGLVGYTLVRGDSSFIGESAMRIVWQLTQGAVCGVVLLFGLALIFRRKAGIVLLHSGLVLLMLGEFYVTYAAIEQRMNLTEGQVASHTIDLNTVEFMAARASGDNAELPTVADAAMEDVVVVPAKRLSEGTTVQDPQLPFDIKVIEYMPNSTLEGLKAGEQYIANRGIGQIAKAIAMPTGTGVSTEQSVNLAACYVQLFHSQTGEDLGIFLASQNAYRNDSFPLDTVAVDGVDYRIGLRFRHIYKPYSIELIDVVRTDYVGTDIPKHYASEMHLVDVGRGIDTTRTTWMNNPVRYGNETFYQSGYDQIGGQEFSVLQIVENTGWMIPYISCMLVVIGLFAQFGITLQKFLRKDRTVVKIQRQGWLSLVLSLGLVVLVGGRMLGPNLKPATIEKEGMRLDQWGQIPITNGGRVQPMDSLARNVLKKLNKLETAMNAEGERVPAIRWLADTLYRDAQADHYLVFKIMEPDVTQALGLAKRKNHLYSLAELKTDDVKNEFDQLLSEAIRLEQSGDKTASTLLHQRIIDLSELKNLIYGIRMSMGNPMQDNQLDDLDRIALGSQIATATNIPLNVPPVGSGRWQSLSVAILQQTVPRLMDEFEVETPAALADVMVERYIEEEFRPRLEESQIVSLLMRDEVFVDALRAEKPDMDMRQLEAGIRERLKDPPPEIAAAMEEWRKQIAPAVDQRIEFEKRQLAQLVLSKMNLLGNPKPEEADNPYVETLGELHAAYAGGDADQFNGLVERHLQAVEANQPQEFVAGKVESEIFLNRTQLFYTAMVTYIIAFGMVALSWLGMPRLHRAALALILFGLVVHSIGLVLRIYISGRPPVTNLYSSAVFIAWAVVIIGLALEWFDRKGIGLMVSAILGAGGLQTAQYIGLDNLDTFSVLRAVLDTQFWLTTHVIMISIGYATTIVAGVIGLIYLIDRTLSPWFNEERGKSMIRMVYGVTCFAMFFSFFGTVLGGLWADDSWGRFWGWDPKENGALLIVLANALLLHARWAGIARDRGIAALAVLGIMVTLWSWFAVNELDIGLHAYGRTEGKMMWVSRGWLLCFGVTAVAYVWPLLATMGRQDGGDPPVKPGSAGA